MSKLTGASTGDVLSLTVSNVDGSLELNQSQDVLISFSNLGDVKPGETKTVSVTVEKCIHDPSGSLDMVFVSGNQAQAKPTHSTKHQRDSLGGLHDIATDLIGDTEFNEYEDRKSSIEGAKEQAKKQGRDPAIDPKLNE